MPKVIVARLRLIDPKEVIDLIGRDLDNIHSTLLRTPYQKEISEIPNRQLSVSYIQNALLKNYINTCREIIDHSPKDIGLLLSEMMVKFESNNVKAMLRAKESGLRVEEAMKFITPAGRLNERRCRDILERSEDVSDVLVFLQDLEYVTAIEEAISNYKKTGTLLLLEMALDRFVYGQIHRAVRKLKGRDGKIARTVIGIEIDSINIKIILRGKSLLWDQDQIGGYLLPTSEVLSEKVLITAIKASNIMSFIKSLSASLRFGVLRDYQYMLTDLLKEYEASQSLPRLEIVLDRSLLKTSLRMLKRYTPYFNIGLVFAFLNAKWFEVKNLRAIVRGSVDGVPSDMIRELLILPN
jgi:V/A-type H+-transporting ATPase subunit C